MATQSEISTHGQLNQQYTSNDVVQSGIQYLPISLVVFRANVAEVVFVHQILVGEVEESKGQDEGNETGVHRAHGKDGQHPRVLHAVAERRGCFLVRLGN